MQRVHDSTIITLLTDTLPDSASQSYVKERKTTQVPKDKQKGKSFEGGVTVGDFPKVRQFMFFWFCCVANSTDGYREYKSQCFLSP